MPRSHHTSTREANPAALRARLVRQAARHQMKVADFFRLAAGDEPNAEAAKEQRLAQIAEAAAEAVHSYGNKLMKHVLGQ